MMNGFGNFLSGDWAHALGWTLLHSLWQSLVILLLVRIFLRLIPSMRSALRYAVLSGGLFLLLAISVLTFAYLINQASEPLETAASGSVKLIFPAQSSETVGALPHVVSFFTAAVEQNIPLIISLWIVGFLVFAIRLTAGLFYTQKIKSKSTAVENTWSRYIVVAAQQLGINRMVTLAESAVISAPMVIGYFKPVILIPVGMLTGLSPEQLETIFLHELAHIRRHDYLINFIQSAVETIFFFNPLVWVLSDLIRTEREYCCDDLVVRQHGATFAYANALVQLAETKLSRHALVLSLADDKNQLLNRIRRIMEKSVRSHAGGNRKIIPAILLLSALLCISWLGIRGNDGLETELLTAEQDTIPPEKENVARYSRKRIITIDENGQPHEQIIEEFEGDEDFRPLLEKQTPSLPDISSLMPPLSPQLPDSLSSQLPARPDTIPPLPFDLGTSREWEEFSKAFQENFRMDFQDLFAWGEDPSGFMKEFEERFGWKDGDRQDSTSFHFNFPPDAFGDKNFFGPEALENLQDQLERFRKLQMEQFETFKQDFGDVDKTFQTHEKSLRDQLIEDGYLSGDERIESMEWSDESFKVNGKSIKEADRKKYKKLYHEFLD